MFYFQRLSCRKRRQFFGDLAMIFKYGQQIPRVKVLQGKIMQSFRNDPALVYQCGN
jgi:hypothetical protein